MIRDVQFKDTVKEKLRVGAEKVFKTVASTMGAKGKYVGIQNRFDENYLTKDGYYSAQTIHLADPVENMGCSMIKEVAHKSSNKAGDGTTTSTVLTYHLYAKGVEAIEQGFNAVDIKKGFEIASKAVIEKINTMSIPIKEEMLNQVATVSANNNNEIGTLITDAMSKIKEEGSVLVEDGMGYESSIEVLDGMRIDKGYVTNYFVNKIENMSCEYRNAFVLVYYGNISTLNQIEKALEWCMESGHPLVIVALEIEQEALQTMVINKTQQGMKVLAVRAPGVGGTRKTWLEDIAAATGAYVISENTGATLRDFNEDMLGSCKKVVATNDSTTFVEGGAIKEDLEKRVDAIRHQIKNAKKTDNVGFHKERLSKIDGGVAIIHVGYTTEVELREKKDLFEDAIAATRAAREEGIVPGGGTSLVKASQVLQDHYTSGNDAVNKGITIFQEVLTTPLLTIMENAGVEGKDVLVSVLDDNNPNWGFNLNTEEYCDMIEAGILDTAKIERIAVENATSIASMMLMLDTVIYNVEPNTPQQ
jgi:chaperonin GroEL